MSVDSSTTPTWQQPTWDELLEKMFADCSEKVQSAVPSMDASAQDLLRRAVTLTWALGYREVSNVHVVLAALGLRRECELKPSDDKQPKKLLKLDTWRTSSMFDALLKELGARKELQLDREEIGGSFPPLACAVEEVLTEALFRAKWGAMVRLDDTERVVVTAVDVLAEVMYKAPSDALFTSVFTEAKKAPVDLSFLLVSPGNK